ncbi:pentapeptide repeat-containing protein [Herbidospora sp. NEAU-GS84]|uniref:Pentapeptide repeat-containing protein n=1 Tax=Herbidospora solisilvae TaxID=2696284 RepID=A0A7C9NJU3_9ACTN|nr:pentapeptide repeat-containing protein [Herbidospora solisilvae]NAS20296.1 pentapeptide repeat-containing protein [Herbidospora solisilvae]
MIDLRSDCASCAGLCCVELPFTRSADFAVDKPAGKPCVNLTGDFRCRIHDRLLDSGYQGCVTFDCFGAGQRVTQEKRDVALFPLLRQLHELLWYLDEAGRYGHAADLREETEALAASPVIDAFAIGELRARVGARLGEISEQARGPAKEVRRDLAGARLRGHDLRNVSLRGRLLIGADLRGADLRGADLLGADLRGADVRGADLRGALFLTRPQVAAARGDRETRLDLDRPGHWR